MSGSASALICACRRWTLLCCWIASTSTACSFIAPYHSRAISDAGAADGAAHDTSADGTTDVGTTDAGASDAPSADGGGAYELQLLKALWATPNSIAWAWQCTGTWPGFAHYELIVGTDATEVSAGIGTRLDPASSFALARLNCQGEPWAELVLSYDLQAETTYFAQLILVDADGPHVVSALAEQQTPAPATRQAWIFDDQLLPGGSGWYDGFVRSKDNPQQGQFGLVGDATSMPPDGFTIGGFVLDLTGMTTDDLSSAYLELYLDVTTASQVGLTLAEQLAGSPATFEASHWLPHGYIAPDAYGGYQRIQVPISEIRVGTDLSAPSITLDELQRISAMRLFGGLGAGNVYVDTISIWY